MASQTNSDMWMGAASSDISMPSNPVLDLGEETSWKAPASSQNTTNMEVKDNMGTPSFSKGLLEEEWYTPEASLMDLSYSSPYGSMSDTRTSFGSLLESTLNFDSTNNLVSSFRSAPTLGMQGLESNRLLEDLACTGQGSSVGLLSSISPGGQLGRSNPMDSFSSGLPSSLNHGIITTGGSLSNITSSNMNHNMRTSSFPRMTSPSFPDAYPAPELNQNKTGKDGSGGPRNELVPYNSNNRTESQSYLQGQQTLFQKRATSRRDGTISPASKSPPRVVTSASNDSSMDTPGKVQSPHLHKAYLQNASGRADINSGSDDPNDMGLDGDDYDGKDDDDLDESGDGSGGPYEVEEGAGNGTENNGKGNGKGKRGLPAKNLMAERRRRKKLNDRLYMLRSVVPKITKMDRASILGDAIEYLKELLQRINDIHNELEAAKLEQSRSMPSSPTPRSGNHSYPATVKEECPVLPNPESQPPRVEVRKREGQALNIHMFCARRPGLLLSTVRALDALGLDVQQAVISCFNGFALDLFRAEAKDMDVGPEEIKAVLLLTAGCGMHSLQ